MKQNRVLFIHTKSREEFSVTTILNLKWGSHSKTDSEETFFIFVFIDRSGVGRRDGDGWGLGSEK